MSHALQHEQNMTDRCHWRWAFLVAIVLCVSRQAPAQGDSPLQQLLTTHCSRCHNGDDAQSSEVDLSDTVTAALTEQPELLQRLIGVIDRREMPPDDAPQLSTAERSQLLSALRVIERDAIASTPATDGAPLRRMTRFQYHNAVTDLFDLKCEVFTLPERLMRGYRGYFKPESGRMADAVHVGNRPLGKSQLIEPRLGGVAAFPQDLRAEHGFDNQADHLSLSPLLMEAFVTLGESITRSPDFTPKNVGVWDSLFAPPKETADASHEIRARLSAFLSQAFREQIDTRTLDRYTDYTLALLAQNHDFTSCMKSVTAAALASPRFLYLHDRPASESPAGEASKDHDFALASRLAFFLWGSLPDEELLDRASAGDLHTPDVLSAQVTRMLNNLKLKRFCDSFPAQWLQLDRLISSAPNRDLYPQFYFSKYRDSMHMMLEPLLLFETVLLENLPITQLIDPEFTYRSAHLEEAYGALATPLEHRPQGRIGEVTELTFYRVPIVDRRGGGVITNAAVMTMTSGPDRTKPITRGSWVASVIFNTPPPPPPADVPPLPEHAAGDDAQLTLRERLAMHRERSDCRGCHDRIDPLGFALENYDAIGAWRDQYENGREVDAAGELFHASTFRTPVEFKQAILEEKDRFTEALASHLLAFGLARELTPADQPAVRRIARRTKADGYRMQTLLREVVLSAPFRGNAHATQSQVAEHAGDQP